MREPVYTYFALKTGSSTALAKANEFQLNLSGQARVLTDERYIARQYYLIVVLEDGYVVNLVPKKADEVPDLEKLWKVTFTTID